MEILHVDFETRSTVDLKKCGADVYARHPSTDFLCVGWALGDRPVQMIKRTSPLKEHTRLLSLVEEGHMVAAHNAPFEILIWNEVMTRHGWPFLNPAQTICTMAMAYAMALPGALEKAAHAMGIDKQKDMAGSRVMMKLSQPAGFNEDGSFRFYDQLLGRDNEPAIHDLFERLYAYCAQDIEVERELCKRLMALSPQEKALWFLDFKINQRGIQIDTDAAKKALELVEFEQKRLNEEMKKVTGGAVATCTATGQLTDWLRSKGVALEGVAKADVTELLNAGAIADECRRALLLRQEAAKSSTAKLSAMLSRACDDGRIRGTTQYHGAGTGRWAGRGIQVQNFPRPKLSQKEIEAVFKLMGEK